MLFLNFIFFHPSEHVLESSSERFLYSYTEKEVEKKLFRALADAVLYLKSEREPAKVCRFLEIRLFSVDDGVFSSLYSYIKSML